MSFYRNIVVDDDDDDYTRVRSKSGKSSFSEMLVRRFSSLGSIGGQSLAFSSSASLGSFPSLEIEIPQDPQQTSNFIHSNSNSNSKLNSNYSNIMQELIPAVNKLMDVFHTINYADGLDLPQIVVVGSQSAGKSSVLENIVQKDFLPRGKDIVTRRPLVLQLINIPSTTPSTTNTPSEYAEFLHLPDRKFFDFSLVRLEIEKETERVAGLNKGISKVPIHLRIYSPKVLNLTLVDLPGITKIPIGDQPPDIEIKIRKVVLEYISKPNSLILAVSPANQDIVNSDALKIAREVDPDGKRTIGVLTKLDLMDAGTNALDILNGKYLPLKLGFIGIINRSQQDISENKSIEGALKSESEFFKTHPAYRQISNKCGTQHLAKTLNMLLMQHIREKLPELKAKLNIMIIQTEQELSSYGDAIFTGQAHRGSLVLRLLTKFASNFNSSIDGTYAEISTTDLCGGARLYYIFNNIFGKTLDSIDPCAGLTVNDIRIAIRNSTGPRPSLFIPELAFDLLIKPQLKKLELPSLRCAELVFDELLKIVNSCQTNELSRFPKLNQKVIEVVVELLRERMAPTQSYIESLISIQLSYINTNHQDFLGGNAAISILERKHERKRRDLERLRRQNNPISVHLPNAAPSSVPVKREDMIVQSSQATVHARQVNRELSQHGQIAHGKDGGFLTYFFGNPSSTLSEVHSRSSSPSRTLEKDEEQASNKSNNDEAIFNGTSSYSAPVVPATTTPGLTEKEEIEVELIRSLIHSYFQITRKTIADLVPKTIMHLIVNFAKDNVQNRLVSTLYKEELFGDLLMEDDRVMKERERCKEMLDVYRKAAIIMQDIF